tara:strand:- start:20848 stop:21216 length:369 start_codon:yes stop_codon:yes gene_type:complete
MVEGSNPSGPTIRKHMKTIGAIVCGLLAIVLLCGLIFGFEFLGMEKKRFFAPRHAEIDRQVFEQTPSYIHGKNTYLTQLQGEYDLADSKARKATLKTIILREAATIDRKHLNPRLLQFINSL